MSYLRDPATIYAESFRIVRSEADLSRFGPAEAEMAVRLIHACGMTEIAETLVISDACVAAGQAALAAGASVICDSEMVAQGVIRRGLPDAVEVVTTLNDPRVPELAEALGTTRSALAHQLPLSPEIGTALTRGTGALGQVLRVVSAYEHGDLTEAATAYRGEDLVGSVMAAMRWSTMTLGAAL